MKSSDSPRKDLSSFLNFPSNTSLVIIQIKNKSTIFFGSIEKGPVNKYS
jgi:hypothetical protein